MHCWLVVSYDQIRPSLSVHTGWCHWAKRLELAYTYVIHIKGNRSRSKMEPWGIDTISLPMPHTVKAFAKARPINFPVSHPLARQKYLLHQNKNNTISMRIDIWGFRLQKNTKILIHIYIVFFKLCLFFSFAPSLLFVNLGDEKQEIYLLWPKIWKHRNNYIAVVKGLKPFINLPADQLASGGVSWEEPRLISFHVHIHCGAPVSSVLPRPVLVGGGGQELLMSLREEHRWQSQSPYL